MTANFTCLSYWCMLPHTFHRAFSGSSEPPASIRKVIRGEIRKTPSAWVSHWSHLHRKAEIPWRVTRCSGLHRHIPLLEGWDEDGDPGLKNKLLLKENQQQDLWQFCGRRIPMPQDRPTFPSWHIWIICGLPSFQGCQLDCLCPTLPSSVSWRQWGRGVCVCMCAWVHRDVILLGTAEHVCTHKTWYAGCACPPGKDRDKNMAAYTSWTPWGSFPAFLLWFSTKPGSCRSSSSRNPQATYAPGTDGWYKPVFRGQKTKSGITIFLI